MSNNQLNVSMLIFLEKTLIISGIYLSLTYLSNEPWNLCLPSPGAIDQFMFDGLDYHLLQNGDHISVSCNWKLLFYISFIIQRTVYQKTQQVRDVDVPFLHDQILFLFYSFSTWIIWYGDEQSVGVFSLIKKIHCHHVYMYACIHVENRNSIQVRFFSLTKKDFSMHIDNNEQSLTQIVWENRLTFFDKTCLLPYNV